MSRRSARPADCACARHLPVFSAAETVTEPGCELGGLSLRVPLPGCGAPGLDPGVLPGHRASGPWRVLAGMWRSTMPARDNGALRVIPGSHCGDRDPVKAVPPGSGSGDVVVGVLDRVRLTAAGRPH